MDANISDTWRKIPFVTRYEGLAAIVLFLLMLLSPRTSLLFWRLPKVGFWQVWRPLTAPLCYYGNAMGGVITVYMLVSQFYELETSVFMNRGRTAYYYVWIALGFATLGPYLQMYHYATGLVAALSWTLAQENPQVRMTVAGVIPIERRYFPLANIVMSILSSQSFEAAYESLLGIFLAHSFIFFTEFLPQAGGPTLFAGTPRVFRKLDELERNAQVRERFGRGQRLASRRFF